MCQAAAEAASGSMSMGNIYGACIKFCVNCLISVFHLKSI